MEKGLAVATFTRTRYGSRCACPTLSSPWIERAPAFDCVTLQDIPSSRLPPPRPPASHPNHAFPRFNAGLYDCHCAHTIFSRSLIVTRTLHAFMHKRCIHTGYIIYRWGIFVVWMNCRKSKLITIEEKYRGFFCLTGFNGWKLKFAFLKRRGVGIERDRDVCSPRWSVYI